MRRKGIIILNATFSLSIPGIKGSWGGNPGLPSDIQTGHDSVTFVVLRSLHVESPPALIISPGIKPVKIYDNVLESKNDIIKEFKNK